MIRRDFLRKSTFGAITLPSLLNGFHVGINKPSMLTSLLENFLADTDHVLVLVRLDGGNDGLNTVVPLDQYSALARVRPKVLLPESSLLPLNGYSNTAFHPAMSGMQQLFNEGKLSVVQSVGYPNPNFSHFRATDIWMTGSGAEEVLSTGWLGRYLNYEYPNFPNGYPNTRMPDPLSLEIGGTLSLAFQGPSAGMGMAVSNPAEFYNLVQGIQAPAPNTPAGEQLKYVRLIARQSNTYGQILQNAFQRGNNRANYPDGDANRLAEQLKIVARLISGGLKTRVYMVSIGGFDTHANQVVEGNTLEGLHANLLRNVSEAISAFVKDTELLGVAERVVGMTFSEFGRRVISNFSNGTDHGSAAPMFLFGKSIRPGILGDNPLISPTANETTNLPMQYDFRSMYTTLLRDWFCVPDTDLQSVTLQEFQHLPLIKDSDCFPTSSRQLNQAAGLNLVQTYPNPFSQSVQIDFETQGGHTLIQIFTPSGQIVAAPINQPLTAGTHSIYWHSEDLPPATYYVRFQNGMTQQVKPIVKVH